MLLYAKDTGIVYSVMLANAGSGDYIKEREQQNFQEKEKAYEMECFSTTDEQANALMYRWGQKCKKGDGLPNGSELSCSAYIQAVGMDAPIWVVVMPSVQ